MAESKSAIDVGLFVLPELEFRASSGVDVVFEPVLVVVELLVAGGAAANRIVALGLRSPDRVDEVNGLEVGAEGILARELAGAVAAAVLGPVGTAEVLVGHVFLQVSGEVAADLEVGGAV